MPDDAAATGAGDAVLALLDDRAPGATICPSEVARVVAAGAAGDWRVLMPTVHAAVDRLVAAGRVRLSWKDTILPRRNGPYRIARREKTDQP